MELYRDLLHGTAYLLLRDRAAAEDVTQEAFLSAWRGIDSFDAERPLRPWLIRVLVNEVRKRQRRKLLRVVPLPAALRLVDAAAPRPEDAVERAWERSQIWRAVEALSRDAQRVVVLRYFAELSVPEVAEVLAVPEGTVKSRLHRAHTRLRDDLERRGLRREPDDKPEGSEA